MNNKKKKATLIIPHKENKDFIIEKLLDNIETWTAFPNQIIIVNSSKFKLKIQKFHNFCKEKKIFLKIINYKNLNPGAARNIGIKESINQILCFLDVNTLPSIDWFEKSLNNISKKKIFFLLGQTFYCSHNYVEKIIRASTYGSKNLTTIPGSFFKKDIFKKIGLFIENLRCGEDTDLITRIKLHNLKIKKNKYHLKYMGLIGKSFKEIFLKWKKNYSEVLHMPYFQGHKFIYGLFAMVIIFFITVTWNWIFANWNINNPLYIPNITKIFLTISFAMYFIYRGLIFPLKKKRKPIFFTSNKFYYSILFFIIFRFG